MMSALVTRPPSPLPWIAASSMSCSAASRRTSGDERWRSNSASSCASRAARSSKRPAAGRRRWSARRLAWRPTSGVELTAASWRSSLASAALSATGAAGAVAAPPSWAMTQTTPPTGIVSPSWPMISTIVPEIGAGISAVTLSVDDLDHRLVFIDVLADLLEPARRACPRSRSRQLWHRDGRALLGSAGHARVLPASTASSIDSRRVAQYAASFSMAARMSFLSVERPSRSGGL